MKVILVPGFWLDASSWDRRGIGLSDHVAAVVEAIDAVEEPVVLVGPSGGGAVVHGAVDQRPGRVARAVYVDSGPLPDGAAINPGLPEVDGEIPLPPFDVLRGEESRDLDDLTDAQLDVHA